MNWTSHFSLWWLLPICVFSLLGAYFLYQKKGWILELTEKQRLGLMALRFLVLFCLFVLLFGFIFEYKKYRDEKPIILAVIDNSSSVLNYSDSSKVKPKLKDLKLKLEQKLDGKFDVVYAPLFPDSLNFKGDFSNLSGHLNSLRNSYLNRNIGAVVMASDGNYNKGANPFYVAEKFNFVPFYTVGIGDTVQKRDQLIRDIIANEYAFLKNDFPIEVEIEGRKLKGATSTVELYQNGKLVSRQAVAFKNNFAFHTVTFMVPAAKLGVNRFTVKIIPINDEYNLQNNIRDIYVEVLDSRSRILILSEVPHPDISAIKASLETNENYQIESSIFSKWKRDLQNVDLIVWHEPGYNSNFDIASVLAGKKIPILFVIGPNSGNSQLSKLKTGIQLPASNQTDEVEPAYNSSFELFSLSDEAVAFLKTFPPLLSKYGQYKIPTSAKVMLNQRIGPVVKDEPLQFFYESNGNKFGAILGEGIWKWRLHDYVKNESFLYFDEWINKSVQYLVTLENKSPFVVQLPKNFGKNDEVIVNAEVYDGSMVLNNQAEVKFEWKNDKGLSKKYTFAKTDKAYRLNLGKLKPGLYDWSSSVIRGGKKLSKSGSFIVNDERLEDLDNEANHTVLRQISSQTKGKFAKLGQEQVLFDDLSKRTDITTMRFEESSFMDLIDWKWLFFILLIAFTAEWFMRKWWGGY